MSTRNLRRSLYRLLGLAGIVATSACQSMGPAPSEPRDLHITGRIHFNINISQFQRSREFYRLLGFADSVGDFPETNTPEVAAAVGLRHPYRLHAELLYLGRLPAGPMDLTQPTGRFIDLIEWLEPQRTDPPYARLNHLGIARFALQTTNIDADVDYLDRKGVRFLTAPAQRQDGSRFVITKDPDGTFVELVELPGTRTPAVAGLHIIGIHHVSLNVTNLARSVAFYRNLGFTKPTPLAPTESLEVAKAMGFDGPIELRGASLTHGIDGSRLELVQWLQPFDDAKPYAPPINHLGMHRMNWGSADLEGDVAKLKAADIPFLSDIAPCCTGASSTFGIAVFADPDGIYNQLMGNLRPKP